jgi:hypothetical protein
MFLPHDCIIQTLHPRIHRAPHCTYLPLHSLGVHTYAFISSLRNHHLPTSRDGRLEEEEGRVTCARKDSNHDHAARCGVRAPKPERDIKCVVNDFSLCFGRQSNYYQCSQEDN